MWLTLIRHAEPAYVADGMSWTDPPLTTRGKHQAERLAERAAAWQIDELWVSPMVRTAETAEPLVEATGVEPETMEWLKEIQNPSEWDGSPADEIEQFFAQALSRPIEELWEGSPGGESFYDFHQRIHSGLAGAFSERGISRTDSSPQLWQGVDDRRVVIVAHAGTNALILGMLLGLEPTPWEWERFSHVHAGVSRLLTQPTAGAHSFSLRILSDRRHLPPGMVTG